MLLCPECGNTFKKGSSLKRHALTAHTKENANFVCQDCNRAFTRADNLKRHKMRHARVTVEDHKHDIYVGDVDTFECAICTKQFYRKDALSRHISFIHNFTDDLKKHLCLNCGNSYSHKGTLRKHILRIHTNRDRQVQICDPSICTRFRFLKNEEARHFQEVHNTTLVTERFRFNSLDEFEEWKQMKERETFTMYCNPRKITQDGRTKSWSCHRSGKFTAVHNRKRRPAKKGSKKMNAHCPSKLLLRDEGDGSYTLRFISTHFGHPTDVKELAHVRFSAKVRNAIAESLAAEIPAQKIIKSIRTSEAATDEITTKEQMLTKKDVRNIRQLRNISNNPFKNVRDSYNIVEGVDAYVIENAESVLFYKKQGQEYQQEGQEDEKLLKKDFVIVLMKPNQIEKLIKFGSDIICLDGTHGISNSEFVLQTLLVRNEYMESYPCAFMISNRQDEVVLRIMFQVIKQKIEHVIKQKTESLSPRIFMSNNQSIYINAWIKIMNQVPQFILFSTWYVLKSWKENYHNIKSAEMRHEVDSKLMKLHRECNETEFQELLLQFISDEDESIQKFLDFFVSEGYVNSYEKWAYCYRQSAGINANMSTERFHMKLKCIFANGKNIQNILDAFNLIDDYIEQIEDLRKIESIKGKACKREAVLKKIHKQALSFHGKIEQVDNGNYIVQSFGDRSVPFTVTRNINSCYQDCKIKCEECNNVCIHMWRCTCVQNMINARMCEHIHVVCLNVQKRIQSLKIEGTPQDVVQSFVIEEPVQDEIQSFIVEEAVQDVVQSFVIEEPVQDVIQDLYVEEPVQDEAQNDLLRIELKSKFDGIMNVITSIDQYNYALSMLHQMETTLSLTKKEHQ